MPSIALFRFARLAVALTAVAFPTRAQEAAYAVTPATRAAVGAEPVLVRLFETTFTVEAPDRAVTVVRLAATAFEPAGRGWVGQMDVPYDSFRRIRRFEGVLRDASGRVVRRLRRDDVEDFAAQGGNFYDDLRIRSGALYGAAYPFTVEWTYEVEHDGVLGWPTWYPQPEGRPVETATLVLDVPTGTLVRHQAQRLDGTESAVDSGSRRTRYTWQVANRPAIELEPFGPSWEEQTPTLQLGTDRFEIGGAAGQLDSWQAFGAWYGGLAEGRQVLPEAARQEVARIVEGAPDAQEKVRRLYAHLQRTTRYVSVQLGLGGWQPDAASQVHERRYGDCKALTNYLHALLAEAGVRSYPALVRAGENAPAPDPSFPSNPFNHVILQVPLPDTTLWLESTSATAAFGRLGAFTEGRPVLLVTPDGGQLVETPRSDARANRSIRTAEIAIDATGAARVHAAWTLAGEPRDEAVARLAGQPRPEREAWLRDAVGGAFDVETMETDEADARPEAVHLAATWAAPRWAQRAGRRLLFALHRLAPSPSVPPLARVRTQPVRLGAARVEVDTVRIALPEGYALDAAPAPVALDTGFGHYARTLTVSDDGRSLVYVRRLELREPHLPAEAYADVRQFYEAVARADAERVVLAPR